jgi:hypothetical protein
LAGLVNGKVNGFGNSKALTEKATEVHGEMLKE